MDFKFSFLFHPGASIGVGASASVGINVGITAGVGGSVAADVKAKLGASIGGVALFGVDAEGKGKLLEYPIHT